MVYVGFVSDISFPQTLDRRIYESVEPLSATYNCTIYGTLQDVSSSEGM